MKRVSYLSLEFLMGRTMQNALLNMDLDGAYAEALREIGYNLEDLYEQEKDAALGNGGLGRLAACFLDSMATLDLPAWGYGIRYDYGIFKQVIRDGAQVEIPDYWLTFGNPWEIERQDIVVPVRYYGSVRKADTNGVVVGAGSDACVWEGGEVVMAVAYDNPIPGFDTWNTINLRLWKALPSKEFDFASFNSGDYLKAVEGRHRAETITQVLYPSDSSYQGKELRLKQQYFFVAATLADVIRRFKRIPGWTWAMFSDKNAIQLNDTHPTIVSSASPRLPAYGRLLPLPPPPPPSQAIVELMRVLVDLEGVSWSAAWTITKATFAYTNHTILPEALEKWSVDLMSSLLPRHLEIIYKINWVFMEELKALYGEDWDRLRRMSIIDESHGKYVRMAHLAIVGSHAVNGVAAIHTELVKSVVFPDFYALYPDKFQNKTNGVTPRRWINQCNPGLASILSKWLDSEEWLKHLNMCVALRPVADNEELQAEWQFVKRAAKVKLAAHIKRACGGLVVSPDALFDVHVKRIHEYKRQQLNALYCIYRYRWIKSLSPSDRTRVIKRVVIFGGKAAPGYDMAKRIIRLIHKIAAKVNNDPDIGDAFKVAFIPNYNVSLAEIIVPASDLSQHVSTAGMEASGTSNMKFAMNGGLIIGTMDGANIEIAEAIDRDNVFIFGAETEDVPGLRDERRNGPARPYCPELTAVLADIAAGEYGSPEDVAPLLNTLRWENDYYLVSHDFPDYMRAQAEVDAVYANPPEWTRRSILSTAGMGRFSTDRTIQEYADEIWGIAPARRQTPISDAMGRARSFPSLSAPAIESGQR